MMEVIKEEPSLGDQMLHRPTPPPSLEPSSRSSRNGPPSPRKKNNMMQSSNVKRKKKESDWVAQEKRLEVIQFLQIPDREKRICLEIDSLVDIKEAETFHTRYTNAMSKEKQLHDDKIILYSHARAFDRAEKERFSKLNIELRIKEKRFSKLKYHKELLLREAYKEHLLKELKVKEEGLEDIAKSKNIKISEIKDIREKIRVLKVQIKNRVNYTFLEMAEVLDI
jgi:hypothetical protein